MARTKLWGLLLIAAAGMSAAAPPSAQQVVRDARARAAREGKNVLVVFHASWCPWCRRLDALIADPRFAKPFAESYVLAKITVRERDELRATENAGWAELMRRLRGAPEQDVPYLVVLSPSGAKLGDSYRPSQGKIPGNAGFPRAPQEIEAFLDLIRRTGRAFSAGDRVALKANLRATERPRTPPPPRSR